MSQTTYLHFYSPELVKLSKAVVGDALKVLGVTEAVRVYRLAGGLHLWESVRTGEEEWPATEVNGIRIPASEASLYYENGKHLAIDCIKAHPSDRCAQLVQAVHERFPTEVSREFYLNNLVVNAGPHDIFESVENPNGELFAATNFSVAFWGYRHPADLSLFRAFIDESPLVDNIKRDLADVTSSRIECQVYLT